MRVFHNSTRVFLCLTLLTGGRATAQQLLYATDFDGPNPPFTLNTTDAGSTSAGDNRWVINNVYAGGNGTLDCLGFPFSFTVPPTASQPAGIASPGGNYLHIASSAAINSGILNCNFVAADGLCSQPGNHFAGMTQDVSTLGALEASVSFWWLCGGGASNYGEVYYSTDGGSSWTLISAPIAQYRNQQTWIQQTITLPELGGHATLRLGFRFVNGTTISAQDPGFGVDDLRISVPEPSELSVLTSEPVTQEYCQGSAIEVPYTVTGAWAPGNVFTAQLSDASGSFAAPVAIGSTVSGSSGTISGVIPSNTPAGAGYRVRVVASAPVFEGAANALDLAVLGAPSAGADAEVTLCKNTGTYVLLDLLEGADACGDWTSPTGASISGIFNSDTDTAGDYLYTTDCSTVCAEDDATLTISLQNPANAGNSSTVALCSNDPPTSLYPYVAGGDLTGLFFYQGQTFPLPDLTVAGTYVVNYVVYGTAPCLNDSADLQFVVNEAADAGQSSTLTICTSSAPVDLVDELGDAQTGGTWTGPDNEPFSGILDPLMDGPGLYTYTVQGIAPCEDDEAFVAVIIDPCLGVDELGSNLAVRWAGRSGDHQLFTMTGGSAVEATLLDATGRMCTRKDLPAGVTSFTLPMADERHGLYLLVLRSEMGIQSIRFIHDR
jgi:hypothetical protein